jgi:hypothetical protein
LQKRILVELLINVELMLMWKIKCLDLFYAPPPLFWRGGWGERPLLVLVSDEDAMV